MKINLGKDRINRKLIALINVAEQPVLQRVALTLSHTAVTYSPRRANESTLFFADPHIRCRRAINVRRSTERALI